MFNNVRLSRGALYRNAGRDRQLPEPAAAKLSERLDGERSRIVDGQAQSDGRREVFREGLRGFPVRAERRSAVTARRLGSHRRVPAAKTPHTFPHDPTRLHSPRMAVAPAKRDFHQKRTTLIVGTMLSVVIGPYVVFAVAFPKVAVCF